MGNYYDYINNDNIILQPIYDGIPGISMYGYIDPRDFYQISVTAYNSAVKVNDFCFDMTSLDIKKFSKVINKYLQNNETMIYEYKNQIDNNDMIIWKIQSADMHGHVIINLKLENSLDNGNKNYAELFIETELGLLESFSKDVLDLTKDRIGFKTKLFLNKEL